MGSCYVAWHQIRRSTSNYNRANPADGTPILAEQQTQASRTRYGRRVQKPARFLLVADQNEEGKVVEMGLSRDRSEVVEMGVSQVRSEDT